MNTLSKTLRALVVATALVSTPVALAAGGGHGGGGAHAEEAAGHGGDAHGEAAGHGEDHGGGHHVCYSCDDDHDGVANWMDSDAGHEQYVAGGVLFHLFNLALFLGVIYFGAGNSIRDMVRFRAVAIRRDIDEASSLHTEAKTRHDAVQARLAALDAEIQTIKDRAAAEAEELEASIKVRAEQAAERIGETAQRQIRDEAVRAQQALRAEAVNLAVELAEGILTSTVQAGDQQRLAQQFLDTVNGGGQDHV